jgi:hypothetical protein
MKTLKSIVAAFMLLAVCGAAKATSNDGKLTKSYAINTYIDAMTRGRLNGLGEVLDKSASFNTVRGKEVLSLDRKQELNFLEGIGKAEQNCVTNTSMVESNDNIAIVKVDMKYDGFTRSNYITIAHTAAGWKVTNVYSTFS